MKNYKVRHKETGLYSTGGMDPEFNTVGKTWNKLQHVRSHLAQFEGRYGYTSKKYPTYLDDVEIVEFTMEVTETKILPNRDERKD